MIKLQFKLPQALISQGFTVGIHSERNTEVKDRDHSRTKYCYDKEGKALLVSYVVKKNAGVRNVLVLSTMHKNVYTTRDECKKPQVITFYYRTKGGVDVMDMKSKSTYLVMEGGGGGDSDLLFGYDEPAYYLSQPLNWLGSSVGKQVSV